MTLMGLKMVFWSVIRVWSYPCRKLIQLSYKCILTCYIIRIPLEQKCLFIIVLCACFFFFLQELFFFRGGICIIQFDVDVVLKIVDVYEVR